MNRASLGQLSVVFVLAAWTADPEILNAADYGNPYFQFSYPSTWTVDYSGTDPVSRQYLLVTLSSSDRTETVQIRYGAAAENEGYTLLSEFTKAFCSLQLFYLPEDMYETWPAGEIATAMRRGFPDEMRECIGATIKAPGNERVSINVAHVAYAHTSTLAKIDGYGSLIAGVGYDKTKQAQYLASLASRDQVITTFRFLETGPPPQPSLFATWRQVNHDVKLKDDGTFVEYFPYGPLPEAYGRYSATKERIGFTYGRGFKYSLRADCPYTLTREQLIICGDPYHRDWADPGPPLITPTPATIGQPYSIPNFGATSITTDGSGAVLAGYARTQPGEETSTLAGIAVFSLRQSEVLVSETAIPSNGTTTSARIYAEIGGRVDTGIAIVNPNGSPATIQFHFTDSTGVDFGANAVVLNGGTQGMAFLDERPFNALEGGRQSFRGTFSLKSSVPISIAALRGYISETRNEFLMTTLPVTDLSATPVSSTTYLPHFAVGDGWTTQVVLVNATDTTLRGTIQFFGQGTLTEASAPVTISGNGTAGSIFNYSIPRRGSFTLTASSLSRPETGSVRVVPSTGPAPAASLIFSLKPAATGITVSEAGVPAIRGSAFRMFVESTGRIATPLAIQTALAITNVSPTATTVLLELFRIDGTPTGLTATFSLGGNGQKAEFIHELFPELPLPFRGVLRISAGTSSSLSLIGLRGRYNERGDFLVTTMAPVDQAETAAAGSRVFPLLINGGGYTTQLVLLNDDASASASGTIQFLTPEGKIWNLIIKQ